MKLSIIIPVYNVGSYVKQFCNSLFPQLRSKNVEVIIVDDGSSDNSIATVFGCITSHKVEPFIKIITQKNAGLSAARNTGINNANGEYITFIDPDDYVTSNYIITILDNLIDKVDVLTFNAKTVTNDGSLVGSMNVVNINSSCREIVLNDVFNSGKWYAWCRVIRKDIIQKNLFPSGKRFEDLLTIPDVYIKSSNLKSICEQLVYYRENPKGISKNPKLNDVTDVESYLNNIIKKIDSYDNIDQRYYLIYISSLKSLFYITNDFWGWKKSYFYLNRYRLMSFKVFIRFLRDKNLRVSINNIIFILFIELFFIRRNLF